MTLRRIVKDGIELLGYLHPCPGPTTFTALVRLVWRVVEDSDGWQRTVDIVGGM